MNAGGERAKAQPPESWPRPLTKSLNSPSRLDHLRDFFFLLEYEYFHFLSGRLFFSLAFTPPQFPRDSKPHNSCIRPGNPSPGGRVKSLCLRPLPPADPAPARPLGGICLGGGRGWFPAWEQTPEPAFPLLPWEGLPHLSRSPLLPPTAAGENNCLQVLAGTSDRPRRPVARGSRLSSADPEEHTVATAALTPGGDSGEGRGEVTTDGAHEPHDSRDLLPCKEVVWLPWVARSGTGPTSAPWCPTRCISHPLSWRSRSCLENLLSPSPPGRLLAKILSFLLFVFLFLRQTGSHIAQAGLEYIMKLRPVLIGDLSSSTFQVQMSALSSSPPTLLKNILVCYYYRVYVWGARACYLVSVEAGSQLH